MGICFISAWDSMQPCRENELLGLWKDAINGVSGRRDLNCYCLRRAKSDARWPRKFTKAGGKAELAFCWTGFQDAQDRFACARLTVCEFVS
jgi:hypothetical protein